MNRFGIVVLILASLSFCALLFARHVEPSPSALRASGPIVIELFTSEGCSSCPPADALLRRFDLQPYPGAQLIVLSEHVDYWNHIGWRDPFSSARFSERQSSYRTKLGLESVYTPQMVVDGTQEFVGSSAEDAGKAFSKVAGATKVPLKISSVGVENHLLRVRLETGEVPATVAGADVVLAVALDHAESEVKSGENSGRHLTHVAVLRSLWTVGAVASGQAFMRDVEVKLDPGIDASKLRVIAFLQEPGPGRIVGAAEQTLGK